MSIKKYNRAQRAIQEMLEENLEMKMIIEMNDQKANEEGKPGDTEMFKLAQHFVRTYIEKTRDEWRFPSVTYDGEEYCTDYDEWETRYIKEFKDFLFPTYITQDAVMEFIRPSLKDAYEESAKKARLHWLDKQRD